jgi:DNA repair protein RadC
MFRDYALQVMWKKRLEAAEKRHNQDLEGENRQLGACQRRLSRLKEVVKFRVQELRNAGIEPTKITDEDPAQGTLFELAGIKPPTYTPGEADLGLLEDDPGFPRVPSAHGLPACVVGNEKACQIEARERMVQYGAAVLSTAELVAIALGIEEKVARAMIDEHGGIIGLFKAPIGSLLKAKGVGKKTALRVKAVSELSARINASSENMFKSVIVQSPDDLAPLLRPFRLREVESFWIALLNARNRLIALREVCKGTVDACAIHPRDLFSVAILEGATGVIIAHNHPSGNPRPSPEDLSLTDRIRKGAEALGIRLMDHLIVAGDRVVSLRALGLW